MLVNTISYLICAWAIPLTIEGDRWQLTLKTCLITRFYNIHWQVKRKKWEWSISHTYEHTFPYTRWQIYVQRWNERFFIFETTPMNTSVQNLSFRTLIPLDMVSIVSFDQAKDKLTMLKCIIFEINLLFMLQKVLRRIFVT